MAEHIATPDGRRLKKIEQRATTATSDSSDKAVYANAPRVCYNMPNEEFFPLMMRLRDKAVLLMGDRLAELVRWNAADRDKVLLWFGDDSETVRQTLNDGLTRMRGIMRGLTEKSFVKFSPEGVRAAGCLPRGKEGDAPAAASVCKEDGTYTVFIGSEFCDKDPDEITLHGVPKDVESKLTIFIHEVSHFPAAMNAEDHFYGMMPSRVRAKARDEFCLSNSDSIAYYVANIPNWTYRPPAWKP
ncbi:MULTISPECIES: M35 family metallo-endopeptidase [Ralstonia]|jgi:hypothetical protein|uniref:Lysine-specific metallo-endopeptidase domain-containing protein n=1 Tax=Ralstonia flaminis TaxID=3058597 RepID=A0ABM9KAN5_9RALS|nr:MULTISPECIES: M35 family metallo-endopeptidase [unclassified Ralstonia]CAJ0819913.1 hypothetical protein LMG18101_04104 [Ralstonia sp. LMG 18101]